MIQQYSSKVNQKLLPSYRQYTNKINFTYNNNESNYRSNNIQEGLSLSINSKNQFLQSDLFRPSLDNSYTKS